MINMKIIIALVIFSVLGLIAHTTYIVKPINAELDSNWAEFKLKYSKNYSAQLELIKRMIWEKTVHYIEQHNLEYKLGKQSSALKINEDADLTREEILAKYGSGNIIAFKHQHKDGQYNTTKYHFDDAQNTTLTNHVDWREKGAVTPVKNQHTCGACYSFSIGAAMESHHFIRTGKLMNFSQQQVIDCSYSKYYTWGCYGGDIFYALEYVQHHGIQAEEDYPYANRKNDNCSYDKSKVKATFNRIGRIRTDDENHLAHVVANVGPVAVSIVIPPEMPFFDDGIIDNPKCGTKLTHTVLVVGYGEENGRQYWLVKNSWGTSRGDKGYFRMSRNKTNQCLIARAAYYPAY